MSKSQRALSLLPLCLASAFLAWSQSPSKTESPKADPAKEAFVIEQSSCKMKFENDGSFTRQESARVRIQSDAGVQRFGLLSFSYEEATGTLDIDYVRVRKPEGTVVITPPESIQDMAAQITREAPFYSDLHEKQVAVKGLGIGDVLEFETHHHITKPLAPGQFWFEYSFTRSSIVLQEQLEVSVPKDRAIKIRTSEVKPTISEAGQYRVYAWTTSNLEHKSDQDEKRETDKTVWEQARGQLPPADIEISSFTSWEEVGHWYETLQQERVKPTPEIRAKAAELTKDAPNDRAKVEAIYHFVSTKFRYIGIAFGIGRYQPHAATEVLDNQYGDCKDKHTLLASLLAAVGIKAYPVLISTTREIDADVPSPGQFDHVITRVPQADGFLWLDATAEVGPFEYLTPNLRDKHALVIVENEGAALIMTPANPPFPSMQTFNMDAKLSDAGLLQGDAQFSARGDLEYLLRSAFRRVPFPNWKDLTQRVSYGFGFAGDVSEVTASAPEKTDEPFHLAYKYTRKDFGDWPNHRTLSAVPSIALPLLSEEENKPSVPMWLGPPAEISFHSKIELPTGYRPELPSAIHEKRDFAEYDATYSFKDGALIADRHLRVMLRQVSPGEYDEYKKFRKIVEDDYSAFIPLSSNSDSSPAPPRMAAPASFQNAVRDLPDSADPEAMRLEQEARDAATRKDVQSATSSLYRAVAADPKFTRAWITLGVMLMSSHQVDAGVDAFHKAVATDPKRPLTYKAFGYSLMANAKFDDSIPVWQSLIKADPEDVDGPANLGSVFFQLKRYPEAISALESAVKMEPERVDLQQRLGMAYLYSGSDQKAADAFGKILELEPGPQMLNNLAYELADHDKQLPLALQYAEKATRELQEESQKISLSKLTVEDLGQTLSLASYWDTLGWVHSRMSSLDQAEKYLTASWVLSQDGIVGGHLCHVYERLHKTQDAIRMCKLALYRLPLSAAPPDEVASDEKEIRSRLEHLSPGSSKSQNINLLSDETSRMRSFKLARLTPATATAEFFVLLAADSKASGFKVQDVKFISGSEKLKSSGKALALIDFKMPAPDAVPTRLVRRGVLGCYPSSGCSFLLLEPNSVHSVN